ncbi:MAG: anti-sigma factor (TIGR02949 family) [Flavobacteriaceae bacterium]|jgi:anti-sigma factor (TIGR02949 family)
MPKQESNVPPGGCSELEKFLEFLNLMLDKEASIDQIQYLDDHLEKCMSCLEKYQVEKELRQLIKSSLVEKAVPAQLAVEIRKKVFQSI